jgi:cold shock CspA family protein/ribosome-associated translation inhibitor RaiA
MEIPLKITFRGMAPSKAIESSIREKAAKLEEFYQHIMGCRVAVEAPHRHRRKGRAYVVRIDLTVPGGELVVNRAPKRLATEKLLPRSEAAAKASREPSKHGAHEDAYVAIRDAFNAAGRRLQDYARRQNGAVKLHAPAPVARVSKLFPDEKYGFLETPDGREIYFHRNSVLPPGYQRLRVGTECYFTEEKGDKGPQASSVRAIGQ